MFTISVGNLPAKAKVLIKITYVCELRYEGDHIVFELPSSVAPWDKQAALAQQIQVRASCVWCYTLRIGDLYKYYASRVYWRLKLQHTL